MLFYFVVTTQPYQCMFMQFLCELGILLRAWSVLDFSVFTLNLQAISLTQGHRGTGMSFVQGHSAFSKLEIWFPLRRQAEGLMSPRPWRNLAKPSSCCCCPRGCSLPMCYRLCVDSGHHYCSVEQPGTGSSGLVS